MEKFQSGQKVAVFVIGNEVLLGEVDDKNTSYFIREFRALGVDILMTAILPDEVDVIAKYIRSIYMDVDYIILTGGIGPTPDDVTRESVAAALGLSLVENEAARKTMEKYYGGKMNRARMKMATIPKDAILIPNPVSGAPGFISDKIMVFPGIPGLIEKMFPQVRKYFQKANVIRGIIYIESGESTITHILKGLIEKYESLSIGSYPTFEAGYRVRVVIRGREEEMVRKCVDDFIGLSKNEGINVLRREIDGDDRL